MRILTTAVLLIPVVMTSSCTGKSDSHREPSDAVRSDLPTVEQPATEAGWTLLKDLTIGAVDGPAEYVLDRVLDIEVDSAGSIYVLLAGDCLVRVFDSTGQYRRDFGGPGEGPSEFKIPIGLDLLDDSILSVFDQTLEKLALFHKDGRLWRTIRITVPIMQTGFIRSFAMLDSHSALLDARRGYAQGLQMDNGTMRLLRVDLARSHIDTLVELPGQDVIIREDGRSYPEVYEAPFARAPYWAAAPDGRIAYGRSDSTVIQEVIPDEPTPRRILLPRPSNSVTPEDEQYFRQHFPNGRGLESLDGPAKRAATRALANLKVPATWPAFDGLVYDALGYLWVEIPTSSSNPTGTWDVFDPNDQFVTQVQMPAALSVYKITSQHVYGVSFDKLGVPYIERFRLHRGVARDRP